MEQKRVPVGATRPAAVKTDEPFPVEKHPKFAEAKDALAASIKERCNTTDDLGTLLANYVNALSKAWELRLTDAKHEDIVSGTKAEFDEVRGGAKAQERYNYFDWKAGNAAAFALADSSGTNGLLINIKFGRLSSIQEAEAKRAKGQEYDDAKAFVVGPALQLIADLGLNKTPEIIAQLTETTAVPAGKTRWWNHFMRSKKTA